MRHRAYSHAISSMHSHAISSMHSHAISSMGGSSIIFTCTSMVHVHVIVVYFCYMLCCVLAEPLDSPSWTLFQVHHGEALQVVRKA